jgi:outer membrane protein assembly factor BamB
MKTKVSRALTCLCLFHVIAAAAQESVRFSDLAGWWSAQPEFGGDSARMALQFVAKDGKQEAQLSAPALGVYDYSLGELTLSGNSLDTRGLAFPLTWNPATQTLSGHIPNDIAPVYNIPIEFKRSEPVVKQPLPEWKAPRPKVAWTAETGAAVWAGIERDPETGLLFIGNENGVVHAIDASGKTRWKFETGKPIRAQPRVIAKFVYVASDSGFLHKLARDTGVEAWRARIDHGSEPRIPTHQEKTRWDRYGSSVVSDGKQVFIASRDRNLYALDMKSGAERWRLAAGDIMTATPVLYRDTVIFAAYDGKVQAVAIQDAAPRWTYDAKLAVPGDLTISGHRLLVGSRSYDLIALDARSGRELWKTYYWFSWIESPPVVRDGVVYTGSSDATKVYAIDLADGVVRWKTSVPGWSWQRVAVNDALVIAGTAGVGAFPGSRSGSLLALDRASGAIRWMYLDPPSEDIVKTSKGWGFGASPVIHENRVYAADLNGRVYAIEVAGGKS